MKWLTSECDQSRPFVCSCLSLILFGWYPVPPLEKINTKYWILPDNRNHPPITKYLVHDNINGVINLRSHFITGPSKILLTQQYLNSFHVHNIIYPRLNHTIHTLNKSLLYVMNQAL